MGYLSSYLAYCSHYSIVVNDFFPYPPSPLFIFFLSFVFSLSNLVLFNSRSLLDNPNTWQERFETDFDYDVIFAVFEYFLPYEGARYCAFAHNFPTPLIYIFSLYYLPNEEEIQKNYYSVQQTTKRIKHYTLEGR